MYKQKLLALGLGPNEFCWAVANLHFCLSLLDLGHVLILIIDVETYMK